MKEFSIKKEEEGLKLTKYCQKVLKDANSSFIFKMLRKKNITLNGKKSDGNDRLCVGDKVVFFLSDETFDKFSGANNLVNVTYVPSLKKNEIVFESKDLLVAYKPAGELSQKANPSDVSINERIVEYLKNDESVFKPGVCNRLDRNTQGLILCGKNIKMQQQLNKLLAERNIDKYYLAIIKGVMKSDIDAKAYLYKDEEKNLVRISDENVDGAVEIHTKFHPICYSNDLTFVKIKLLTGKSHQIRAMLAHLGYAILGDPKYGKKTYYYNDKYNLKYQLLLAYEIVFPIMAEDFEYLSKKSIRALIPDDFNNVLKGESKWVHGNPEDLEDRF